MFFLPNPERIDPDGGEKLAQNLKQ